MAQSYKCSVPKCKEKAEYVRFVCEEVIVRPGQNIEQMRKAPVQQNVLVRCPFHGERYYLHIGHHISRKRSKRRTG